MLKILALPWVILKRLFALAFPMVRGESGGSAGDWVARLILLSVVLGVLALVNEILGIKSLISYGRISRYWLPLMAFCLYAMIWLGWWLYHLINLDVPRPTSEYQDIDDAWREATEALARAGIHLENTPLFLVLGGSSSGEEALFQSAAIKAPVKHVPQMPSRSTSRHRQHRRDLGHVHGGLGPGTTASCRGRRSHGLSRRGLARDSLSKRIAGPIQDDGHGRRRDTPDRRFRGQVQRQSWPSGSEDKQVERRRRDSQGAVALSLPAHRGTGWDSAPSTVS